MELNQEHIRAIIYFYWKKGETYTQCHSNISGVLGDSIVSKETVFRWYKEFRRGRDTLKDDTRSGRPRISTDEVTIAAVQKMLIENPRVTYIEIQDNLKISSDSVHKILHQHLGYRKLLSRFVPHSLSQEQKNKRMKVCQKNIKMLEDGGSRIISKIITGDETYVYFFDQKSPQELRQWVHKDEPPPAQGKKLRSVKKVLYAVFFRSTGLVKAVRLDTQKTVTANWYTTVCLPKVFSDIGVRYPILHHDNASSHTADLTRQYLVENKINIMEHPPYSPDLAPCDYWLFPGLKRNMRGRRFSSDQEIEDAIMSYFESIEKKAWLEVFSKWKERMERCIDAGGDYFEHT